MTQVEQLTQFYTGKRVLVTGDTGFKGSWLATWLLSLGATVFGLSLPPKTSRDNYVVCALESCYPTLYFDLTKDWNLLYIKLTQIRPDIVFHLAAETLVLPSIMHPYSTFSVNVLGTLNLFEAISHLPDSHQPSCTVVVTSDKCYRPPVSKKAVFTETDPLGGANDPYSASKAMVEIMSTSYAKLFSLVTVRAGNVIGGGDWNNHRIVPDCVRAIEGSSPVLLRHPEHLRPWQHVLEPLYGYLLLPYLNTTSSFSSTSWNFGPTRSYSVRKLVTLFLQAWGLPSSTWLSEPATSSLETSSLRLNSAKAQRLLHWQPVLSLSDAVTWTVQEYQTPTLLNRLTHIHEYERIQKTLYNES